MYTQRLILILSALLLVSCSSDGDVRIPGLYRIDIQQGNVIDQAMIDRLRPGMDKNQVQFILGTPAVVDTFHSNQWEYLYTMAEEGDNREQRHIRVHFQDGRLAYIDGDVISTGRIPVDTLRQSRTVEVPLREERRGLARIFGSLPFIGDGEEELPPLPENDEETP